MPPRRGIAGSMEIPILYRDRDIILCLKPVGVSSEAGGMPALLGGEIYCVHRLDAAVGGLMVYARTKAAAAGLSRLIAERKLQKRYLALIQGRPEPERGEMRDLLFHDQAKNKTYVVKRSRRGVKEAELAYRLLERAGELSLVEILLKTGRSHQIRVQFASLGMPLAGDVKYGSRRRDCPIALWSAALRFPHPVTGKPVCLEAMPPLVQPWTDFSDYFITKEHENEIH